LLGYLLLVLVPVCAIAYIIWEHRRKTAVRDAAAEGRLQELLAVARPPPGARSPEATRVTNPQPESGAASSALAATTVLAAPPSALYTPRARVLTPPQTLLYYLLRTGLSEYVVLARVSLASVIEAGPSLTGFAREEQIRRLAALTVDFLVVDKSMRPIAVVELTRANEDGATQADRVAARARVKAAGVRYLELDSDRLPRKDGIRTLVLGDTAAETLRSEADATG
jgi:hypothetical protein